MPLKKISPCNRRLSFKQEAVFRYRFGFIRNGQRHLVTPWRNNLIQDCGLDLVATTVWCNCFDTVLFGDAISPVPVRRNSGAITVAQAANTLTASGNFFVSSDVGRLWKFDSGNEVYITAFTDAEHVTVSGPSASVSASPGTVWYVNETALSSLYSASATYGPGGADNGTTAVGNVVTHKRSFVGNAVSGPVTLTEIGFNNSGSNTNVFDRDIITGGVSLITGDQPFAVAELIQTWTPNSSTAAGNVGTGFDSSGNIIISGLQFNNGIGMSFVQANGSTGGASAYLEPSISNIGFGVLNSSFSFPAFSNGDGPDFTAYLLGQAATFNNGAYSSGDFHRDLTIGFGTPDGNGTIGGFAIRTDSAIITYQFTTPFIKNTSQIMNFVIRRSWQRILAN